jgi:ABC-type thiamine transport system substrate-binding protein
MDLCSNVWDAMLMHCIGYGYESIIYEKMSTRNKPPEKLKEYIEKGHNGLK